MGLKERTGTPSPISSSFKRIDAISRAWSGIEVSYQEKYPIDGHSWTDMQSDKSKILIRLGQRGGICEPRIDRNQALKRVRYDAGFFNVIPAHRTLWCFADGSKCFATCRLRSIWTP
jgi:hypothetical protein